MNSFKLHVLHCGHVRVDRAVPFRSQGWNPFAFTGLFRGKKKQVVLPVAAYLLEHPRGVVLFDTGWHTDMRATPKEQIKHQGLLHYKINKAILPEGQAVTEQLAALGYSPESIDCVVLTHLDTDHVGGVKLLQRARKIITSQEEWKAANRPGLRYKKRLWRGVPVQPFSFRQTGKGPQNRSYDLFGDGSVELVHTPGHSKGIFVTVIKNGERYVLLTSDCGYARKSWEELVLPGLYVHKQQAIDSLRWVRTMASSPRCVAALASHDPAETPRVIQL